MKELIYKSGNKLPVEDGSTIEHYFLKVENFAKVDQILTDHKDLDGTKLGDEVATNLVPTEVVAEENNGVITVHCYARFKTELELVKEQLNIVNNGVDAISDAMVDLTMEVYNG